MFPLWTYGYWQSKERYKSQEEVVDVVRKYRELGIPLDGIIQDWQYWGHNYLWNAMDFQNPTFNNPQKMIEDVHCELIMAFWKKLPSDGWFGMNWPSDESSDVICSVATAPNV